MDTFWCYVLFVTYLTSQVTKAKPGLCLLEGDMKCSNYLSPRGTRKLHHLRHLSAFKRSYTNGPKDFNILWPVRTVPYKVDATYSGEQLSIIQKSLATIESATCIKFVPFNQQSHRDYVSIVKGTSCFSDVGRVGGEQQLSLSNECFKERTIYHELLHTLGFFHEHNRPDRDQYVRILRDNIDPNQLPNFVISDDYTTDVGPFDYDYSSVMHYKSNEYSKDGRLPTILPIDSSVRPEILGSSQKISPSDIAKINYLYKCEVKSCPTPKLNENVQITTPSLSYPIGSSIKYSCSSSGFILVGSNMQICLSSGSWSGQRPRCLPVVSHYCDFESSGLCGWKSLSTDPEWEKSSGRINYRTGTGPLADLTIGTLDGHFLRLNTMNTDAGMRAKITTPLLSVNTKELTFCVDFGYYMWGSVVGSLKVNYVTDSGSAKEIFSVSGASGPKWNEISIPFAANTPFRIEFEATVDSELGDIAIDDISIEPCSRPNPALRLIKLSPHKAQSRG